MVESFVDSYPVLVDEIAFVGHSMGGLVIQEALYRATVGRNTWVSEARKAALLGVPYCGSPWAQAGHVLNRVLNATPIHPIQALGWLGDQRSPGLKDLRLGLSGLESADFALDLDYYIGAATIGETPQLGHRLLGDVLVGVDSAHGRTVVGQSILPFRPRESHVFTGTSHLGLMRSEAVAEKLVEWFSPAPPRDSNGGSKLGQSEACSGLDSQVLVDQAK